MEKQPCRNCQELFEGNYCFNCGQREIANHRIKFTEVMKDFFDNSFNLHKGFFYTFWSLIIEPGEVGRAYIAGRRKAYTNPTRFLIIAVAVQAFIDYWFQTPEALEKSGFFTFPFLSDTLNDSMEIWNYMLSIDYALANNLFQVFVLPAIFYVLFKRLGYNFTELLTINFYYAGVFLLIVMPLIAINKIVFDHLVTVKSFVIFYIIYYLWATLSFFRDVPFLKRLTKIIFALFIAFIIRIFVLPILLSVFFPME